MDQAKIRIFAGIGGALFGFAGLVALSIAIVLALTPVLGAVGATLTIASLFIGIGLIGIFVFLRPQKTVAEDVDDIEGVAADMLANLPFEALKSLIQNRPIVATGAAAILAYSIVRDPKSAARNAQNLLIHLVS